MEERLAGNRTPSTSTDAWRTRAGAPRAARGRVVGEKARAVPRRPAQGRYYRALPRRDVARAASSDRSFHRRGCMGSRAGPCGYEDRALVGYVDSGAGYLMVPYDRLWRRSVLCSSIIWGCLLPLQR